MIPKQRLATRPGAILKSDFILPSGKTMDQICEAIGYRSAYIESIIQGNSRISVPMAFALSKAFDTTPEFWLTLQMNYDISVYRNKLNKGNIK